MTANASIIATMAICLAVIVLVLLVHGIRSVLRNERVYRPRIEASLHSLFSAHNELFIGMPEFEMLQTMNFRYDRTCEEGKTIYRYTFRTRGGYGSLHGSIYGAGQLDVPIRGEINGYSEQHDESYVLVECKENKVIKIMPYNMSDISALIPSDYQSLAHLANCYGIDYKY